MVSSILALAFAALADPQLGQPPAQTNRLLFPQPLSPVNSVLMTNAEFRCFSGNKIFFKNDNGYQSFHAADLNTNVLAALRITSGQLEAQQKDLDATNQRYHLQVVAAHAAAQTAAFGLTGDPQIRQPAPDFRATDINGKTVKLSDYKGKIVVLESYSKECVFCQAHYKNGAMQELQRELTANGVVWLIIDFPNPVSGSQWHGWPEPPDVRKTPTQAKQEWADRKMAVTDWIIDWDGSHWGTQVGRKYVMKTLPEAFVIDKDGNLAYQGAIDNFQYVFDANPEAIAIDQGAVNSFNDSIHQKMLVTYANSDKMPVPMPLDVRERAALSWDSRKSYNYVREAVLALLADKPVRVPETKPYGCGLGHIYY